MNQLIQTQECSIIFGKFRGEDNQELFRCPRSLDNIDLPYYINQYRALVAPMGSEGNPFVNDDTEDLRNIEGKEFVGYWRMYFRGGWAGRWMLEGNKPDDIDCIGVDQIIDYICERFPKGCNWEMKDFMSKNFSARGGKERYLVKPFLSEHYKVMIDTKYGNEDYPVRVYCYREKKGE